MSESKKDASENQENKAVKEDIEDVSADTPEVEAPAEASPEDKVASLEKDYLYLRAEFENYKRQAIK